MAQLKEQWLISTQDNLPMMAMITIAIDTEMIFKNPIFTWNIYLVHYNTPLQI